MSSIDEVLMALTQGDAQERIDAIMSIESYQYTEILPEVGTVLRDDEDTGVRFQAAKTLARFADPSTLPELLDGLRDVDMFVRVHVTDALIRIGQPAVDGLIDALHDPTAAVRRAAVKALGKIRHGDAVRGLRHSMNDEDADVRRFTAQALGRIGDKSTVELLGEALRDPDVRVRKAAAGALWDMGDAALPVLKAALDDPNPQTTIIAAYTLTKMGYHEPPEE
ncbi:MAG: HEAT repeat domain-containing protein [Anaerolineae bacterium]|jgi:HEAT repeat protein|nr:HEAT repeat domain-containing protein [Anaerolineae bacterium]